MSAAAGNGQRLVSYGAWLLLGFSGAAGAGGASGIADAEALFGRCRLQKYRFATTRTCSPARNGCPSAFQSLVIALSAATIATVLGTLCAIGLWRLSSKLGEMLRGLLLLPLIIPPIISAMTFYRAWVQLGLLDTYAGIILAHAILAAPMVLITVSASLANFDVRLEQASRNLGASLATTLRRVILPSIRPGIVAGAVFALILSWDEIVVALFIAKFNIFTLPRRMWDGIRENTDPSVAAAAVVLVVITLLAMAISTWIARRGRATEGS